MISSSSLVLNFNSQVRLEEIPSFYFGDFLLLKELAGEQFETPNQIESLASRVRELEIVEKSLATNTTWNKTMPWVVGAIEIALIAATVLGFVFGGFLGFIPLCALSIFDTLCASATSSDFRGDLILPPFGALFYILAMIKGQSNLENRQTALSGAVQEGRAFWQNQGQALLQAVEQRIAEVKAVRVNEPEPGAVENTEQTLARVQARRRNEEDERLLTALGRLQVQIERGTQFGQAPSAPDQG